MSGIKIISLLWAGFIEVVLIVQFFNLEFNKKNEATIITYIIMLILNTIAFLHIMGAL